MFGYVKIGAAVPQLKLADCISNKEEILKLIREANEKGIRVLTFPELALTGYTCGDPVSYTHLDVYKRQVSSLVLQFHRACCRDSAQIVTPFVRVRTYLTRNFATLGPL